MSESTLTIGVLFPEVLGTYGDTGNALVLCERAMRRGIDARIEYVSLEEKIPQSFDIYALGGGEDGAQSLAAAKFSEDDGLMRAIEAERPVLAICASLQVLGQWYCDASGQRIGGMGVLDVTTEPMGRRAIGELVTKPLIEGLSQPLTGFENHGGASRVGPLAQPLGETLVGTGNGTAWDGDGSQARRVDGVVQGSVIATYMHGPLLARNPELADLLIARALGVKTETLGELDVPGVGRLRAERLASSGVLSD